MACILIPQMNGIKPNNDFRIQRLALRLTQRDLARRLRCTSMSICHIEHGRMLVGPIARNLAQLLMRLEAAKERQT